MGDYDRCSGTPSIRRFGRQCLPNCSPKMEPRHFDHSCIWPRWQNGSQCLPNLKLWSQCLHNYLQSIPTSSNGSPSRTSQNCWNSLTKPNAASTKSSASGATGPSANSAARSQASITSAADFPKTKPSSRPSLTQEQKPLQPAQIIRDPYIFEFLGQLNVYVAYYKKHEMTPGDQSPVGILLCTRKNEALVEFALGDLSNQLFVSRYAVEMPKKQDMERFLKKVGKEVGYDG